MRLRRLNLLRYGHLSDVALDFPAQARLHVVLGANEAGKSTALAAIGDALFEFDDRSKFGFMHGLPNLSVGFTLEAADGTPACFVRLKKRRDSLRDEANQPVPELVLRQLLGGATRELFEQAFGLDGAHLREGSTELLRADGEAGESLLAGIGLRNVRQALDRVEEEARSLVGDGRGRRALAEATAKWKEARDQADACAVKPREWEEAEAAERAADAALKQAQKRTGELRAENSRLERVRRTGPVFAQLDAARARLATLANAPPLPADSKDRAKELFHVREAAARERDRQAADADKLGGDLAALSRDPAVLAVQDTLDALAERRAGAVEAEADLAGVRASATEKGARITAAIQGLGLDLQPDAAVEALPTPNARRTVQRLLKDHAAKAAALKASQTNLEVARRRHATTQAKLETAVQPQPPQLLRRTIDDIKTEGRIEADLAKAERARAAAEREADTALAALPLWRGDSARLTAIPMPLEADEAQMARHLADAANALAAARDRAETSRQEAAQLEARIVQLARGETVPTRDAVASARSLRDRLWRLIRRAFDGGDEPAPEERAGLPEGPLPDAFEHSRDDADLLADRRADDAERVADYQTAVETLKLVRERLKAEGDAVVACETGAEAASAAWAALWEPCGITSGVPEAMREWRRQRATAVQLETAAEKARQACADLLERHARARAALAGFVPPTSETEPLAALLRRAEQACTDAEAAVNAYGALEKSVAREADGVREHEATVADAKAGLDAWAGRWTPAIAALGLPEDADPDDAQAALDAWAAVAELTPAWQGERQRIADMEAAIARFAADAAGLRQTLGDCSDEPVPVAVARLARRLAAAHAAEQTAGSLESRIAGHEAARDENDRKGADAERDLASLRALANVATDAELEQAIAQAAERDAETAKAAALAAQLLKEGDGLVEAALREEVASIDSDAAAARIGEIEAESQALNASLPQLSEDHIRTGDRVAELRRGRDAAAHAQRAADALADARAAAERYARLHVARVLLRAGIERFRAEQQGPLLRRAGEHFALLTAGRYVRLIVDEDQSGHSQLRAVRDDRTECPMGALSEGTRDQLYLALRVAWIETQAARGEALPFIADDLLVNFDDTRAAAAIRLLCGLGETTQVILFTHHEHVAVLAAAQADVATLRLPAPMAVVRA